ncbi:hypothetical protein Droror1_Dr00011218 [Drosera rotundifolia]
MTQKLRHYKSTLLSQFSDAAASILAAQRPLLGFLDLNSTLGSNERRKGVLSASLSPNSISKLSEFAGVLLSWIRTAGGDVEFARELGDPRNLRRSLILVQVRNQFSLDNRTPGVRPGKAYGLVVEIWLHYNNSKLLVSLGKFSIEGVEAKMSLLWFVDDGSKYGAVKAAGMSNCRNN